MFLMAAKPRPHYLMRSQKLKKESKLIRPIGEKGNYKITAAGTKQATNAVEKKSWPGPKLFAPIASSTKIR